MAPKKMVRFRWPSAIAATMESFRDSEMFTCHKVGAYHMLQEESTFLGPQVSREQMQGQTDRTAGRAAGLTND